MSETGTSGPPTAAGPQDDLITVIGRGNSGTRMLSHALYASGVHMGAKLNHSGDTVPPREMYEACRVAARHVRWLGGLSWDLSELQAAEPDPEFVRHVRVYLRTVLGSAKPHRGWKLPETTLAFPWIARMFPTARYIHLVRDPRDSLLSGHKTDDLGLFDVSAPPTDDVFDRRVASWKYQHDMVRSTPRPAHFLTVTYEDLVLDHDSAMQRLEAFLGIPLARIVVDGTRIGKWRDDPSILPHLKPIESEMRECGYG